MKVKMLRDKYYVDIEGNDSHLREGEIVDIDKETAEMWVRKGKAESVSDKKSSAKKAPVKKAPAKKASSTKTKKK